MPNSTEHAIAGSATCSLVIGLWELIAQLDFIGRNPHAQIDWGTIIGKFTIGGLVGSISGLMLDVLEPANNPHHRKFFHSKTVVFLIGTAIWKIYISQLDTNTKQFLTSALAGVLSHHYYDSQTSFGLPLI